MPARFFRSALFWMLVCLGGTLGAAEPRTMVGPGATKDEVINAYGWPTGQSQAGTKEVLTYPQGIVTLEKGRVEKVDFSMTMAWPPPRPRPGPSPVIAPPKVETPAKVETPVVNFWETDFTRATQEAERRNARILALFTGSDWSQASKLFREQVASHPDFVNAFTGDFVFLELDFPLRVAQSPEQREHNTHLREHYGVTTYPSMLVLSRTGVVVGQVDLSKLPPGDSFRARVIAAVQAARDELAAKPPPPEVELAKETVSAAPPADAPAAATPGAAEPAHRAPRQQEFIEQVESAKSTVLYGVLVGAAFSAGLLWLLWRKRPARTLPRGEPIKARIAAAASGVPTQVEMSHWPKPRLCALLGRLAEVDGYQVELRGPPDEVDMAFRRPGEAQADMLVMCVAGQSQPVSLRRVRELFACMLAEGVGKGRLLATTVFVEEAQAFAGEHGIELLTTEGLEVRLRDLPPLVLPRVLGQSGREAVGG